MPSCAVQATAELRRILALPRRGRPWEETADGLIDPVTAYFTLPGHVCKRDVLGEVKCAVLQGVPVVRLRPTQAQYLLESHDEEGGFLQGDVGIGKTLLTMLLGVAHESDRIMMVCPAAMVEDTWRKFRVLREHWSFLPMRVVSCEHFGRDSAKDTLARFFDGAKRPALIFDEVEAFLATDTGRTQKIERFITSCREEGRFLTVDAMTATPAKRSLKDFRHIMKWCRPKACPLPVDSTIYEWCAAVDEKTAGSIDPGALLKFCNETELRLPDEVKAATLAVGRRIFETPGVLASPETEVDSRLIVSCKQLTFTKAEDEAYSYLRGIPGDPDRLGGETPDRHPIADDVALWRHARELSLNFFYKWEPAPPPEWLNARKAWAKAVRTILKSNGRELDTEFQVAKEVRLAIKGRRCPKCGLRTTRAICDGTPEGGAYSPGVGDDEIEEDEAEDEEATSRHTPTETIGSPQKHEAADLYLAWHAIKDTFEPTTVPVWVGSTALDYAEEWGRKHVGIIWTEHTAFAEELAKRSKLRYFGRRGCDASGRFIEDADPKQSLIASIASNFRGRNLQAWCESLITSCPPTGKTQQQLLGRQHRPGQRSKQVHYEYLISCLEQERGFDQARRDCGWHKDVLQTRPKLQIANIRQPNYTRRGYAWEELKVTKKQRAAQIDARLESLRPSE